MLKTSPPVRAFQAQAFAAREYFPHRVAVIRKQYPDTFLVLERRGVSPTELLAARFYQINLYSNHLSGLPDELFSDRAVNWHSPQLGQKGLIAAAGVWVRDSAMTITLMQSDLCQQVYRHPGLKRICKTRVENRFGYWYRILFNAILDFAIELGVAAVYSPTAEGIVSFIRKRVEPDLFRRIYDAPATRYRCTRVTRDRAEYWEVPVAENAERVVRLTPEHSGDTPRKKLICIFHDTEENVDTDIPAPECRRNLTAMLEIETRCGVRATYDILGSLFEDKREEIRESNQLHALAFHSFNHDLDDLNQLPQCRKVDLQVRGYRPPRSVITPELSDYSLSYYNFEWLASSRRSIAYDRCTLENGIAKIPILTDDYPLITGKMDWPAWERRLMESARSSNLLAFGLHDCYARVWLDWYPDLLEKLAAIGEFATADELSDNVFWQQGQST
jgi:hypothetical protein